MKTQKSCLNNSLIQFHAGAAIFIKQHYSNMKKQIISKIIPIALLLLAIIFTPSLAQAASGTWSGATDALWTNTPNWSASPAPGTDDKATFNGPGNGNTIID